jgi:hypothetical protein
MSRSHAGCWYDGVRHGPPLAQRRNETHGLPFHWEMFEGQNRAVRRLLRESYPGVLYLDVTSFTALRADSHLGDTGWPDCLHYLLPGPLDAWAEALHRALWLVHTATTTAAAAPPSPLLSWTDPVPAPSPFPLPNRRA